MAEALCLVRARACSFRLLSVFLSSPGARLFPLVSPLALIATHPCSHSLSLSICVSLSLSVSLSRLSPSVLCASLSLSLSLSLSRTHAKTIRNLVCCSSITSLSLSLSLSLYSITCITHTSLLVYALLACSCNSSLEARLPTSRGSALRK